MGNILSISIRFISLQYEEKRYSCLGINHKQQHLKKMKIRLLKATILILLVSSIISCEKDNEDPREYKHHSIDSGIIRMFTKAGEISDQKVIGKFIKSFNDNYQCFNFPHNDTGYYKTFEINFNIISKGKAQVIYNQNKIIDAKVSYKNGIVYIAENDTILIPWGLSKSAHLKCMPEIINKSDISLLAGGVTSKILKTRYAILKNNELHIPIISFIEKKYANDKLVWQRHGMNYQNVFDLDYLKSNEFSDTIVIEERKIIYN